MNYLDLTTGDIEARFEVLPEKLEEVGLSEETSAVIDSAVHTAEFNEEQIHTTHRLVGLVLTAFIPRSELGKELKKALGVGSEKLNPVVSEIETKILEPIKDEIDSFYASQNPPGEPTSIPKPPRPPTAVAPAPQPASPPTPIPPQAAHIPPQPSATPQGPQVPQPISSPPPARPKGGPSPFLLHRESGVESVSPPAGRPELIRPYFHHEEQSAQKAELEQAAARLEIGGEPSKPATKPKEAKTKKEDVRVVNYSGPQTQVDPFHPVESAPHTAERQPQKQTRESAPETPQKKGEEKKPEPLKEIPVNNVLNLKDLPK